MRGNLWVVRKIGSNQIKFQSENESQAKEYHTKMGGDLAHYTNWCGFCQGECKGEHYISPSTQGY